MKVKVIYLGLIVIFSNFILNNDIFRTDSYVLYWLDLLPLLQLL